MHVKFAASVLPLRVPELSVKCTVAHACDRSEPSFSLSGAEHLLRLAFECWSLLY